MKYPKIKSIIIFSVIILLILSSIRSFGSSNEENETNQKTNIKIKKAAISIKTSNTKDEPYNSKLHILGDDGFNELDNIVVSNDPGNESYPSMVMEGYSGLVTYEYEDESETHIYIRNSRNYGQNWSGEIKIVAKLDDNNPDIEINSPSLSIVPVSKKTYGVYVSPLKNSAIFGYFEIDDIVDLNNINTYTYEWTGFPDYYDPSITYDFWDFKNPEIVTYKDTTTPWIIILTGSTNYTSPTGEGPCTNSPMFCFTDLVNPELYDVLIWFPEIQYCSNISISRNYDSSIIYGICEINNGSNQDLLFFEGNPYLWYYGENLKNQTLTSSKNLTHPQIFVKENHIYIVADSDSDGIVLYSSSDGGDSWDVNEVTADVMPPSANPNCPMFYANDTHLFCAFIESGNISLTNSTNYGLNWSVPVQLNSENGSVVEEYRFADLSDKNHVLWTDNREGNRDIYSIVLGIPEVNLTVLPESVNITTENIPFLLTKNWITFTIKNNGEIFVEKVPVEVTYTCLNESPHATEYRATVYYLDAYGGQESFKRPLFRLNIREFINALLDYAGIQNITVTVDPDNIYIDSYPQDNSYTIPVTYKDIFPRLAFLEAIFLKL